MSKIEKELALFNSICDVLGELNIPVKYKGYILIAEVIKLKIKNPMEANHKLFEIVAAQYQTKPTNIVSNINKVVNIANELMDAEIKEKFFKTKYTGGYVTPSIFIAGVANYLRTKM